MQIVLPPVPGAMPVPATPSLIRAVDRIVEAQREVFGAAPKGPASPSGPLNPSASERDRGVEEEVKRLRVEEALGRGEQKNKHQQKEHQEQRWDSFWREVKVRAQS